MNDHASPDPERARAARGARRGVPARWAALALLLALPGCAAGPGEPAGSRGVEASAVDAAVAVAVAPVDAPVDAARSAPPLGGFRFTMYYVADEGDEAAPARGEAAAPGPVAGAAARDEAALAATAGVGVPVYDRDCRVLARVGRGFAAELRLQGTGRLADGRVVNNAGACRCPSSPCYAVLERGWGRGPRGELVPFRSVAVDPRVIPLGTLLYVPELDGLRMPGRAPWGGYVHDGCVIAADRGGGIEGREVDLFVPRRAHSDALFRRHRLTRVTVFDGDGRCERRGAAARRAPAS